MAGPVLRVVQLNAGSLLEPGWPERRVEIVAWLDHLAPDVVCLQEIWGDARSAPTSAWLAETAVGEWHHAFAGAPFGPALWPDPSLQFGSAILSRWPIEASTYHRLPLADDGSGGGFAADVPWELFHARTAGLDVFSCHLAAAPTDGAHRRRQVVAVDELVAAARGDVDALPPPPGRRAGMPAILCGDLNAEPESDELRFLAGWTSLAGRSTYWQDAWRVAGDGPGWTQDWRTHPIADAMNIPRKRIDYVLVGDPFLREGGAGRVLAAALAFHEPRTGVQASDHAGLVVDIAWPQRPG